MDRTEGLVQRRRQPKVEENNDVVDDDREEEEDRVSIFDVIFGDSKIRDHQQFV